MNRYVHFASRITGWNAIKTRVEQLGLKMTDDEIKEAYVPFPRSSHLAEPVNLLLTLF